MKKLLLSLFVGFVGIISFCNAINFDIHSYNFTVSVVKGSSITTGLSIPPNTVRLFRINLAGISCSIDNNTALTTNTLNLYSYVNSSNSSVNFTLSCNNSNTSTNGNIYFYDISLPSNSCPTCPSCGSCTGYNLNVIIPGVMNDTYNINSDINLYLGDNVSSSTVSYPNIYVSSICQGSSECPDGDFSGFSKFYVRHGESTWSELTGMENYYVYLPDYLSYNYDYSYGTDLNFTVGVSYDTGYINDINSVQNYQPTSDDFSKLVGLFGSYGGLLIACLFVIIVFYLIKKMFK